MPRRWGLVIDRAKGHALNFMYATTSASCVAFAATAMPTAAFSGSSTTPLRESTQWALPALLFAALVSMSGLAAASRRGLVRTGAHVFDRPLAVAATALCVALLILAVASGSAVGASMILAVGATFAVASFAFERPAHRASEGAPTLLVAAVVLLLSGSLSAVALGFDAPLFAVALVVDVCMAIAVAVFDRIWELDVKGWLDRV